MPKKFKSLTEVIESEEAFQNFKKSVKENNVVNEFSKIFPDLTKTVIPNNVQKGVLYLSIENSVLRNEIYIRKNLMIEKINNHFNQQLIVDVKFTNFRNSNRKS
jgi:hypothetical protein